MLLGVAIVCEVTATLVLRGALERPPVYAVVVVGYVIAFGCLAALIRADVQLGVAFGIWGAAGVAATALLSAVIFGEHLTGPMLVGLALIVAGVLVVEMGSQRAQASREAQGR